MQQKPYHNENLRPKLIEAGIQIVNESGVEQLSLRKIAAECGVSHGAPYRHFKDKEELLFAMQQHVEEIFAAILQKAVDENKQAARPMIAFGQAYVLFFLEQPAYFRFFLQQKSITVHLDDDAEKIQSNYRPFMIFKEQALLHLAASNAPKEYYGVAITAMWATVHGLTGMLTMPGVEYSGDVKQLVEKVLLGVDRS